MEASTLTGDIRPSPPRHRYRHNSMYPSHRRPNPSDDYYFGVCYFHCHRCYYLPRNSARKTTINSHPLKFIVFYSTHIQPSRYQLSHPLIRVSCPEKVFNKLDHLLIVAVRHLSAVSLKDRLQQDVLNRLGHATRTAATVLSDSTAGNTRFAMFPLFPSLLLLLLLLRVRVLVILMMVMVVVLLWRRHRSEMSPMIPVQRGSVFTFRIFGRLSLRRLVTAT